MKRVHNSQIPNLWFDGLNYWTGSATGAKAGPFTDSDLHDISQQQDLVSEDSTVIQLDKTTLYPVK